MSHRGFAAHFLFITSNVSLPPTARLHSVAETKSYLEIFQTGGRHQTLSPMGSTPIHFRHLFLMSYIDLTCKNISKRGQR